MSAPIILILLAILTFGCCGYIFILIRDLDKENQDLHIKNKELDRKLEKDQIKKADLENIMDSFGNKISNKLKTLLNELDGLPEPMKRAKLEEIQNLAAKEQVDLSSIYKHIEIKSNIDDVGVTEKEVRGIDKNLKRLREIRGDKN